jgi:outer membrane protein OmpA-like peptidoglycan-associated protein
VSLRHVAALAALACLAACAKRQALVVVFPNGDNGAGAVTLQDGKRTLVLDRPFAAGEVRGGSARPAEIEPEEARQIFAAALAAQPIVPARFTLYFLPNSDRLTRKSEQHYLAVLADIRRRPVPQVEAIGHTDTVDTEGFNQRLSLQRAEAVRAMLLRDGVSAAISIAGRGKLDPAVKTPDQVDEPRNRRVVVTVR